MEYQVVCRARGEEDGGNLTHFKLGEGPKPTNAFLLPNRYGLDGNVQFIGTITIRMAAGLSPEERLKLGRATMTCPVHRSLPDELKREVAFVYSEES